MQYSFDVRENCQAEFNEEVCPNFESSALVNFQGDRK